MNTAITDLLPVQSLIHDSPYKDLINNTIGYFLELVEEEVNAMNDGCFLETAEGKYLDLWGKDYNIPRLSGESDEDYRTRLKLEPLDKFNIEILYALFDGIQLLNPRGNTSFLKNRIYSDNHFLSAAYFANITSDEWYQLARKFVQLQIVDIL